MQQDGYSLLRARATSGTELLGAWEALPATDAAAGQVVHGPGYSIVVGDAGANLFAVSRLGDPLPAGGISSDFLAVSDFVKGSMTYQTGPLVYSRSCATADGSYVTPGASLTPGESYRIQVVYDEALNAVGPVEVQAVCAGSGSVCAVTDLVWYGSQEYLLADNFNPHVLEFTVTPAGDTADWCVFTIQGLTGSSSALKAAPFRLQLTNSPEEELRQNPAGAVFKRGGQRRRGHAGDSGDGGGGAVAVVRHADPGVGDDVYRRAAGHQPGHGPDLGGGQRAYPGLRRRPGGDGGRAQPGAGGGDSAALRADPGKRHQHPGGFDCLERRGRGELLGA